MDKSHPGQVELAQLSDKAARLSPEAAGAEIVEHLRWCVRCRSAVADYTWLQREVSATLTAAADGVAVPRSQWWTVQDRVFAGQRRQITAWRISAIAGVALSVCLMVAGATIAASPVPSTGAVAQTLSPEPMLAPAPITVAGLDIEAGEHSISMATPTMASSGDVTRPSPTLGLPPTPPEIAP